jgi:hypothetical protein
VGSVIRRRSFGSSSIVFIVKGSFLGSNDVLNQVIGRLVSYIRVFFEENRVLGDLISDFVIGVLGVGQGVGEV